MRLYNFENRMGFGPEQALSLETSARMIYEKFSLLGIEYVQRATADGHSLFTGPLFSYSLIPLLIFFRYDPVVISVYFALLNVFTGVLIYLLGKKIIGEKPAILSMSLFMFSSTMINHSMFIWIPNYMPLIGILTVYLLFLIKNKSSLKLLIVLGLVTGAGISLQYVYAPFAILVLLLLLKISTLRKSVTIAVFGLGIIFSNLPTVIFDLKHDFYNLRVLTRYLLETVNNPGQSEFALYHFLVFWPLAFLFLGLLIAKMCSKNKAWLLIVPLYIFINLFSSNISFSRPVGKSDGLSWPEIRRSSEIISKHTDGNFNVATITDFNFRAFVYRYTLSYLFDEKENLLGQEDYDIADKLYVVAPSQYNFYASGVYEVNALSPFEVENITTVSDHHSLFLISRQHR